MEKKNANVVAVLLVMAGLLGYALLVKAGSLEPNSPPEPTMKTLQEIYDAVISEGSAISQREGYCQYFNIAPSSTQDAFKVALGKRFVLLKFFCNPPLRAGWALNIDGSTLIHGSSEIEKYNAGSVGDWYTYAAVLDFPDRCVVVDSNETLQIVNQHQSVSMVTTIIGYFYDAP